MRNGMFTDTRGTHSWYLNDQLHRVDGPAVINTYGQFWYVGGQRHRVDGPAVIHTDGTEYWYLNGGIYITDDVDQWMTELDITYPFDDEHQTMFVLTFGGG